MITEILKGALSFITCDTCKVTIAQDTGRPEDVSLITTAVNRHLAIPNTFLGEISHEILTVDAQNGTLREGLQFKKRDIVN